MKDALPRIVIATPSLAGPTSPYIKALPPAAGALKDAGYDVGFVHELGCPYISCARAIMLRKALDAKADITIFIDYDLSFDADALLKLVRTEGDVVAGLYRFKEEPDHYMGILTGSADNRPVVRKSDGAIDMQRIPAGFMKISTVGVDCFMAGYPKLCYGPQHAPFVDLFNHGAVFDDRCWYGEDYAFSKRWVDLGGKIWAVPDLNLDHHSADAVFKGNFHQFMLRQPGGSEAQ